MENKISMDTIVAHCKSSGYIFPGSEIYGGLANAWDYGPLGVELKNNIKQLWWKKFVQESKNSHGIDAAILMNSKVWEASGHISSFTDPLMDCRECKARFTADSLITNFTKGKVDADSMSIEEMQAFIIKNKINCPKCGKSDFTPIRQFNLLFETNRGVTKESSSAIYLRPETAQGQYVNFLNVQRTLRLKIPFGIAQIGKAFRNEITPGNFTFRTIEFDQMEHQLFCKEEDSEKFYNEYKQKSMEFYQMLGIDKQNLKFHDHEKLVFYAKAACDVYYNFPFGWAEMCGVHNRTNYDLTQHSKHSGKNLEYFDAVTGEKFIPYVIENSYGADRAVLAVIIESFKVENLEDGETREVMHLSPALAPFKVAVLPLIKKNHGEKAAEIYEQLCKHFRCIYDDTGSIGKRYRREDSIGTPFCITVDDNTISNGTVTIRHRDTMKQETIKLENVAEYVKKFLGV